MAVVPICFKMCSKDQTLNKGCFIPCTINQEVLGGTFKIKIECVLCKSVDASMKSNKRVLRCASGLRHISANAFEREKPSRFPLGCSSRVKQLRSLDSYFGKFKNDANQHSPHSLDKDSHDQSGQSSKDGKETSDTTPYSIKKVQGGSKSDYDETCDLYIISTMASINIAVYLFEIASPVKNSDLELFSLPSLYGAKINHLILYGEWWRLLTPMFLHTGILHIGLGCWALVTFGPQVCRAYGRFTFFLIYILGGLSGNLTSFLHTPDPTVGGTGPVFAIIGAWLMYQYQNKDAIREDVFENMYHKAIVVTAVGFVLSSFGPIDDWSHFGSAFTGMAYGFVTCPTISSSASSSSETGALVGQNVDPCKSLVMFSIFVLVLSCLLLVFEPPPGSLHIHT